MEFKAYYKMQIKREFMEKFNIVNLNDLNIIHQIDFTHKTKKMTRMPYTVNLVLRKKFFLESFTGSLWTHQAIYVSKSGRVDQKAKNFFVLFKTVLRGSHIFDFLTSLYIFLVWKNKVTRTVFRCYYNSDLKRMTLKLNKINLCPWISPYIKNMLVLRNIYVHFYISNELLFKALLIRYKLTKYISFKDEDEDENEIL